MQQLFAWTCSAESNSKLQHLGFERVWGSWGSAQCIFSWWDNNRGPFVAKLGWVSRAIRTLWSNVNSEYRHLSFIAEHCEHYEVMCILCCRGTCHSLQMLEGQHSRKGTRLCNRIAVEKCCWERGLWWKGGTCCGSQELLGRLNQQSKHPSPSFLTTSAMTASSGAFCKEDYKTSAEKPGEGGQNRLLKASECIQCVYLEDRLKLQ